MDMDVLVSLVAITACTVLAWRSYSSHEVGFQRTAIMAGAWVGIFAILVFLINRLGMDG